MSTKHDTSTRQDTQPEHVNHGARRMKAIVRDEYGQADVLRLKDIDQPKVGSEEVLVRVSAAGVDRGVWHLMTGLPYPVRLAGYGVRAPKNPVIGMDVAGTVEDVGENVTSLQPGERVYGNADGSFAEYAVAAADKLAPIPTNLTFEQAAVVPVSALTALQGLRKGGVGSGQKVLIVGASGGVGTYAVQIAKALGAEVTGVCSTSKVDLVASIGADHVIDYTQQGIASSGERYDVIVDIGGNRTLSGLRRALTPQGTLVIAGGENGGRWLGGADRQLRAMMLSPFVGQKLGTFIGGVNTEDLLVMKAMLESGKVTPVIDRTYALNQAAAAIAYMQAGRARGKVALSIRPGNE